MKKVLALLASVIFSIAVLAQTVTPYSTANFSAVFNNTVTADAPVQNTRSVANAYTSNDGTHFEMVTFRVVDHDIPVDYTSSDFYANNSQNGGWVIDPTVTTEKLYQGHPFTYTYMTKTVYGIQYALRSRYIIVNSREAIFIQMSSPAADSNYDYWENFENTLSIK